MVYYNSCKLWKFNLAEYKEINNIQTTLFDFLMRQVATKFEKDWPTTHPFGDYFEIELRLTYEGKHLNVPVDLSLGAMLNVFTDNVFMLDLLFDTYKEKLKLEDMIYKNYRSEYQNDSPLLAPTGGLDDLKVEEDPHNSSDKSESYAYTKLSKLAQVNDIKKKEFLNTIFKEFNKLFWQNICHDFHKEEQNG